MVTRLTARLIALYVVLLAVIFTFAFTGEAHAQALTPSQSAAFIGALGRGRPGQVRIIVHPGANPATLAADISAAFSVDGWTVVNTPTFLAGRPCSNTVCLIVSTQLSNDRLLAIRTAIMLSALNNGTLTIPDITYDWPGSSNVTALVLDIG